MFALAMLKTIASLCQEGPGLPPFGALAKISRHLSHTEKRRALKVALCGRS